MLFSLGSFIVVVNTGIEPSCGPLVPSVLHLNAGSCNRRASLPCQNKYWPAPLCKAFPQSQRKEHSPIYQSVNLAGFASCRGIISQAIPQLCGKGFLAGHTELPLSGSNAFPLRGNYTVHIWPRVKSLGYQSDQIQCFKCIDVLEMTEKCFSYCLFRPLEYCNMSTNPLRNECLTLEKAEYRTRNTRTVW